MRGALFAYWLFYHAGSLTFSQAHADTKIPDEELLSGLPKEPWFNVPNTSRQYFPIFVGTPVRNLPAATEETLALPVSLRRLAHYQLALIRRTLVPLSPFSPIDFLMWPTQDWNGQPNWVIARYRLPSDTNWHFLTDGGNWLPMWNQTVGEKPLLPQRLFPDKEPDSHILFDDFLQQDDLYFQPMFGNCVYVDRATNSVVLKWPHPDTQKLHQARLSARSGYVAHCVNQPAHKGSEPLALVVRSQAGTLDFPSIKWTTPAPLHAEVDFPLIVTKFPSQFETNLEKDIRIFSGADSAVYPISGKVQRFVKKGAFLPDHDLERLVDYLEERYKQLAITTERQRFVWRGIAQSNLIAKLPAAGRTDGKTPAKVLLLDHFDAAVAEDIFAKTGRRQTCPGADDNATATATLLRAAEVLKGRSFQHDIWFVHLTGEEFPADDLGAWRFAEKVLSEKIPVKAIVLSDFIGWHKKGDFTFQLNPNVHPGSTLFAALALDAASKIAPGLRPVVVPRETERSAVYQTDLQVFEYLGYPGLLFNERVDYSGRTTDMNPFNHTSLDSIEHIDIPFAAAIAKVMIETLARIAGSP